MRRYFITGGTGFVGRALVRELLSDEQTEMIMCLTRGRHNLIMDRRVEYLRGDICDVSLPTGNKFTDVIHAAAEANDLLQPDKMAYYYTVVEGAMRMAEWVKDVRPKRSLFISSGAVEKGDTVYCRCRRAAETIAYNSSIRMARLYSLVGEEMPLNGQYAIGRFFGSAVYHREVRYYKSEAARSYLHVEDCARGIVEVLNNKRTMVTHVGSLLPIRIDELAARVARVMNVPLVEIPAELPHGSAEWYVPRFVDCEQTISLDESLERLRDHFRNTDLEPRKAA